ncbi:MAG: hypothetical protein AAGA30_13120, partial [Planctomycetota bacterium]
MKIRVLTLVVLLSFVWANFTDAHFIWVAKSKETGKVKVFFGEGPYPDNAQFLGGLKDMKVWSVGIDGKSNPLK